MSGEELAIEVDQTVRDPKRQGITQLTSVLRKNGQEHFVDFIDLATQCNQAAGCEETFGNASGRLVKGRQSE